MYVGLKQPRGDGERYVTPVRAAAKETTRIATSGQVQRHYSFEWIFKHNRLRPKPIRFVRLDSEHAQTDGKSVNRGLPVLDMARGSS